MSHEIGSATTRKIDPENIGMAVGILSLCALKLKAANVAKTPLPGEGINRKEQLRHRAVSLRHHGFLVHILAKLDPLTHSNVSEN